MLYQLNYTRLIYLFYSFLYKLNCSATIVRLPALSHDLTALLVIATLVV